MSAFMLDHAHINALVTAAYQEHKSCTWAADQFGNCDTETKMGRLLLAENARSLNARYPNDPGEACTECYEYRLNLKDLNRTPVEIIKLCACYDYQACETDDYQQTPAALIINWIRSAAIANLPGYNDAAWALYD